MGRYNDFIGALVDKPELMKPLMENISAERPNSPGRTRCIWLTCSPRMELSKRLFHFTPRGGLMRKTGRSGRRGSKCSRGTLFSPRCSKELPGRLIRDLKISCQRRYSEKRSECHPIPRLTYATLLLSRRCSLTSR